MTRVALVVDDSMLIRHTVCRFLEELGFTAESATNGLEALEALRSVKPDIIITDLSMPKMDGSEFITRLKAQPETAKIPLVLLVARKTGSDQRNEERADYVIHKDIEIVSQLNKAIGQLLGMAGANPPVSK
jgi:CheY-like chemotaxis protein